MARYKYLGDARYPNAGACSKIILRMLNGTRDTLLPINPATTFPVGSDIGYDITDPTAIKQLDVDPRFERLP